MSFLNINLNDLPQDESNYDLLPNGWYISTIDSAELKETKTRTGQYIKLALKIDGPTHAGRLVFANINIQNANPEAERIGKGQLRTIMEALRLENVQSPDQLIGGQLSIKVATKEGDGQYEAQNVVKAFKGIAGLMPAAQFSQQHQPSSRPAQRSYDHSQPYQPTPAQQKAQADFDDDLPF